MQATKYALKTVTLQSHFHNWVPVSTLQACLIQAKFYRRLHELRQCSAFYRTAHKDPRRELNIIENFRDLLKVAGGHSKSSRFS